MAMGLMVAILTVVRGELVRWCGMDLGVMV